MSEQPSPIERIGGSTLGVATGLTADVAAVLALLFSQSAQDWVVAHVELALVVAGVLIALLIASINSNIKQRRLADAQVERANRYDVENTRLRQRSVETDSTLANIRSERDSARRELADARTLLAKPAQGDLNRFAHYWRHFGFETTLYRWIRDFYEDWAYESQIRAMNELLREWREDPNTYKDAEMASAEGELRDALQQLSRAIGQNFWVYRRSNDDSDYLSRIPEEWSMAAQQAATDQIGSAWDVTNKKNVDFLRLAAAKNFPVAR